MAYTIGTYGNTGTGGWSTFTYNTGAVIYYVSNSDGLLTNDGTSPTQGGGNVGPFKTIFQACSAINAHNGTSWRILLKQGDIFTEQNFSIDATQDGFDVSGDAAGNEPAVIGTYNLSYPNQIDPVSGAGRPKVKSGSGRMGWYSLGNTASRGNYIAILGIEFVSYKADPSDPAFVGPGSAGGAAVRNDNPFAFFMVENCKASYYADGWDVIPAEYSSVANLYLRRNVWYNNYGNGEHGGNVYPWTIEENFLFHNGYVDGQTVANVFNHNFYTDGVTIKFDPASVAGPVTTRGNMAWKGSSAAQNRCGGTIDNNAYIEEAFAVSAAAPPSLPYPTSFAHSFTNNVISQGLSNVAQGVGILTLAGNAPGVALNSGTWAVTGNIATKAIDASCQGMSFETGSNGATVNNNIIYKWGTSNLTGAVGTTGSFAMVRQLGGIFSASVTVAGSGYTPLNNGVITGSSRETTSNNIILTITTNQLRWAGVLYIDGLSGTLSGLNGRFFNYQIKPDNSHVTLFGTGSETGSWSAGNGGICYAAYRQVAFVNDTVTDPSASSANANIFVGAGGTVVGMSLTGDESSAAFGAGGSGQMTLNRGSLYTAGDILKVDDATQLGGGGTGFRCSVSAICVNTFGSNILDPQGTTQANYPDPERTAGTYYNYLFGGTGGTATDLINAILNMHKGNWNPLLMAASFNDYIRQGFGQPMLGSAYADSQSSGSGGGAAPGQGNQSGKIKGPRRKMPHVFAAVEDFIAKAWKALSGLWRFQPVQQPAERN